MRRKRNERRTLRDVEEEWKRLERLRKKPNCIVRWWRFIRDIFIANMEQLFDHLSVNKAFYLLHGSYALMMFALFLILACLLMQAIPQQIPLPHFEEAGH